MIKQVRVLEREFGPFDRVHVEMAREVGKSIDERSKIARGIDRRTAIKRNYLVMDATECEKQFRKRNLNDTRYALRIILGLLRRTYPDFEDGITGDGKLVMRRRVYARPGAVTSALRHVWGVESLKKDKNGERLQDDRHHALDAIITACCSERLLQLATRHAQRQERRGEKFELRDLPPPWDERDNFRREVKRALGEVFVSRPESGRLRGKAHDATIKQIRTIDGEEKLVERRAVGDLTTDDLERIPVPAPYGKDRRPEKVARPDDHESANLDDKKKES